MSYNLFIISLFFLYGCSSQTFLDSSLVTLKFYDLHNIFFLFIRLHVISQMHSLLKYLFRNFGNYVRIFSYNLKNLTI